jgi:tetratricopeptide (TPR) repeat protein
MKSYDQAIAQLQKTLQFAPDFPWAHRELGSIYEKQGKLEAAIAEFQKARTLVGDSPFGLESLGHGYASAGRKTDAVKALNELILLSKERHSLSYQIAFVYAGLADKERAFEWLWKALDERNSELVYLKMEPLWENLRTDLRFNEILKKINLFPTSSSEIAKTPPSNRSARTAPN